MCIDFFDNPNITPNAYILPTDCKEVKNYSTITITDSKKSSYNKYKKDISGVIKNDWNWGYIYYPHLVSTRLVILSGVYIVYLIKRYALCNYRLL